jgi:hypothetical protein
MEISGFDVNLLEITFFKFHQSKNNLVFRSIEVKKVGFQVKLIENIWLSGQLK